MCYYEEPKVRAPVLLCGVVLGIGVLIAVVANVLVGVLEVLVLVSTRGWKRKANVVRRNEEAYVRTSGSVVGRTLRVMTLVWLVGRATESKVSAAYAKCYPDDPIDRFTMRHHLRAMVAGGLLNSWLGLVSLSKEGLAQLDDYANAELAIRKAKPSR